MPAYTYKCPACDAVSEVRHGMKESPETRCPKCQALMKKWIGGGAGVMFKGTGFYCTDFKEKGKQPAPGGCCSNCPHHS